MISIIICSRNSDISIDLKKNIENTIGIDYENIIIDNSRNAYSIFSAYNRGIERSKYPILCFIHEDILFRTKNWGQNLIAHFKDKETGIIGVAGGKIVTKVPAAWWSVGNGYKNLIQHYNNSKTVQQELSQSNSNNRQEAIVLDGVFLSFRKDLLDYIKFDESLSGFHGYDHDISVQSVIAGYKNYVIFNILIEHFSEGSLNHQYYANLTKVHKKWQNKFPLFCSDISEDVIKDIGNTELKLFAKFIRRMTRTGFSTKEIISNATYFAEILSAPDAFKKLRFIRFKIFIERLIKAPKYLFKQEL